MSLFIRVITFPLVVISVTISSIVVLAISFISGFFPAKNDLDFGQQDDYYPVWPDVD